MGSTIVLSSPPTSVHAEVSKIVDFVDLTGAIGSGSDIGFDGREDGSIKMFWTDYSEANGSLILYGKVQDKRSGKYVSSFLKVDGILRNLYFLPRDRRIRAGRATEEEVQTENVYEEVCTVMEKNRLEGFKTKPVVRKYTFELPDVPREGDYLKVLYPYTSKFLNVFLYDISLLSVESALPMELQGETFSRVFGTNTALFEQFVLCRNIMGPCWLKIDNASFSGVSGVSSGFHRFPNLILISGQASWCKVEMKVDKPQQITTIGDSDSMDAPPLTVMSIAVRTVHNAKDNKQEIIAISGRVYENVMINDPNTDIQKMPHRLFTVVRPPKGIFPAGFEKLLKERSTNIKLEKTENMLLSALSVKLQD